YKRFLFQEMIRGHPFRTISGKNRCQITTNGTPPGTDIILPDLAAGFPAEEFLQELQTGCMIKNLRVDPAATAPGRSDNHGYTVAQSDLPSPGILLADTE